MASALTGQQAIAKAMTEGQLQERVLDMARLFGWLSYHAFDSRRSEEGFPDLVLARDGFVLLVELKSQVGRQTTAQQRWQRNALALLWRPIDLLDGSIEAELR